MALTSVELKELRMKLPRGSARKINRILMRKEKKGYSTNYINQVLDAKDSRYNEKIIKAALKLAIQLKNSALIEKGQLQSILAK